VAAVVYDKIHAAILFIMQTQAVGDVSVIRMETLQLLAGKSRVRPIRKHPEADALGMRVKWPQKFLGRYIYSVKRIVIHSYNHAFLRKAQNVMKRFTPSPLDF